MKKAFSKFVRDRSQWGSNFLGRVFSRLPASARTHADVHIDKTSPHYLPNANASDDASGVGVPRDRNSLCRALVLWSVLCKASSGDWLWRRCIESRERITTASPGADPEFSPIGGRTSGPHTNPLPVKRFVGFQKCRYGTTASLCTPKNDIK